MGNLSEKDHKKLKRELQFLKLQSLENEKLKYELSYIKNSRFWKFREVLLGKHLTFLQRIDLLISITPIISGVFKFIYKSYLKINTTTINNEVENGPLISVVIPVYNYYHYIDECVDSVFNQELGDKVEIIIIEGFSNDGSREKLQKRHWDNTRIIYQDHRTSIGENRLRGIEESKGRYICLLDADDKLTPGYFKAAIGELERRYYDIVYPDIKYFGDIEKESTSLDFIYDNIFWFNFVSVSAIFRKSFWKDQLIGYSPNKEIFEDWDFWMRMAKAGARFKHISGFYLWYRIHTSTQESTTDIRLDAQVEKDNRTKESYSNFYKTLKYLKGKMRQRKLFKVINSDINIKW